MEFNSNIRYWLALTQLPGLGPVTIRHCLDFFGDIATFFSAKSIDLKNVGLKDYQINRIQSPNWQAIDRDLEWCIQNHCHILTLFDEGYPVLLREIVGAPILLFVRGEVDLLLKPQLAIVGSRNPTVTGYELAKQFAYYLAKAGLIITSGFAAGIDAASHQGALNSAGKTLAVFGTGLNRIYPAAHGKLARSILENGALISEFMPNEQPKAKNFPRRNRVISGLSLGVLVVEAALKSGSLISARFAAEQGREVFALPGSIHNTLSRGCHYLIQEGAKLVEKAEDILEELGPLQGIQKPSKEIPNRLNVEKLNVESKRLMDCLGFELTTMDTIIVRSGLTASEVSSMLLSLELSGYVQSVQGGYVRTM